MILLKDFNYYNKYFDLEYKKTIHLEIMPKINGWYNIVESTLSALAVLNGKVCFIWGENNFVVDDMSTVEIESSGTPGEKLLKFYINSSLVVHFTYKVPTRSLNVFPFDYIDDEDSDWGNFIASVINNRTRRSNFIENISNS